MSVACRSAARVRLSAGLACLIIGAAACGGRTGALDGAGGAAPVQMSAGGSGLSGAPGTPDTSAPPDMPPDPPPPDPVDEPIALAEPPHIDLIGARVLELLEAYCGDCHSNGVAAGGFGDVLDIAQLIERGLIVPGSSATSPLLARMSDEGPHPASAAASSRRPLRGDLALIARFIDDLALAAPPDCSPPAFMSHDDVYALLSADIVAQPTPDRPFVRYLDLTYASNAGLCGPALARQRHALFKMINSVSTASEITVPRAIDAAELIYRIDLRDYGWDRELDLEGDGTVDFGDGWLALVAGVSAYALELDGVEANALREQTGTAVAVLPVNAFVYASTVGDLYYALIGARGSLEDTRLSLGVDIDAAVADNRVARAAFEDHSPYRESFVLRLEQTLQAERAYWYLEDSFEIRGGSFLDSPLDVGQGSRQSIYNLPNGMQAYWVESFEGIRLGEVPRGCLLEDCLRSAGVNAAGCHGCHGAGLLPVKDQVRDYVAANAREYDNETVARVPLQYPTESALDALMLRDSETHLSAVERAGVPRNTPEPISRVFLQFERDPLTAATVAAELGVPLNTLYASLPILDPRLQVFGAPEGTIDRLTFTDALPGVRCALRAYVRNRPLGCP